MHDIVSNAMPEQLGLMLEALESVGNIQGQAYCDNRNHTITTDSC